MATRKWIVVPRGKGYMLGLQIEDVTLWVEPTDYENGDPIEDIRHYVSTFGSPGDIFEDIDGTYILGERSRE